MKNILVCLGLAAGPFSAHAAGVGRIPVDVRATNFERLADTTNTIEQSSPVRPLLPKRETQGHLALAVSPLIETLAPYELMDGRYKSRPEILDDLYYEQLFVRHPVTGGEHYYPMVAQAIRYARDFSYVTFEIDPAARFQDGKVVTSEDVMASVRLRLSNDPNAQDMWDSNVVKMVSSSRLEVRFYLKVTGQEARDAIAFLARTNIVKGATCRMSTDGSPLTLNYMSTGPYVIDKLGQSKLLMRKNPSYWAKEHPVRQGIFNFATIALVAAGTRAEASALLDNGANFYQDVNSFARPPLGPPHARQDVRNIQESNRIVGRPLRTLTFNLRNPVAADANVRAALTMAYDFDGINASLHAKRLKRPLSLLEDTSFSPSGTPSMASLRVMQKCLGELPSGYADDFSTYGVSASVAMTDKRTRMIAAQSILRENGYYMKDGFFYSRDTHNREIPLTVSILVRAVDYDLEGANQFVIDLAAMGVNAEVSMARSEDDFHFLADTQFYTLFVNEQTLANADGWPDAQYLNGRGRASQSVCLNRIISEMNKVNPRSELYRATADAVARMDQMMYLNIFLGEPARNEYVLNNHLKVPPRLTLSRIHMYGYWQNTTGAAAR